MIQRVQDYVTQLRAAFQARIQEKQLVPTPAKQ
jgi:hypothetical protein